MNIVEFLTAQLDEDERRIQAADSDGEFRAAWVTFRRRDGSMEYTTIAADHRNGYWVADGTAYLADSRTSVDEPFFDAHRALADITAKRRIIELHSMYPGYPDGLYGPEEVRRQSCSECGTAGEYDEPWPCQTLRLLAAPFADRPDYQQEWKP